MTSGEVQDHDSGKEVTEGSSTEIEVTEAITEVSFTQGTKATNTTAANHGEHFEIYNPVKIDETAFGNSSITNSTVHGDNVSNEALPAYIWVVIAFTVCIFVIGIFAIWWQKSKSKNRINHMELKPMKDA